jgi:hypothetical protein
VTSRVQSGASYYGAFDLSGSLWERVVTLGNSTGRSFEGRLHGDGNLDASGNANQSSWPNTTATGGGMRGASWNNTSYLRIGGRVSAAAPNSARSSTYGGRGVRWAAP